MGNLNKTKTYLGLIIKNKMCEPNCSSGQKRRGCREKSPLQTHNLNQILGDSPSLAEPLQKVDWVGVAQVPLKHLEHVLLPLEDLVLGVGCISTVKEVCDRGQHNLLNLGGDEKTCDATSWSLARKTAQVERKWSMMLMARKRVSGSRWKSRWT